MCLRFTFCVVASGAQLSPRAGACPFLPLRSGAGAASTPVIIMADADYEDEFEEYESPEKAPGGDAALSTAAAADGEH